MPSPRDEPDGGRCCHGGGDDVQGHERGSGKTTSCGACGSAISVRGAAPQHVCVRDPGPGELIRGRALDCSGECFSALRDDTVRALCGDGAKSEFASPPLRFLCCDGGAKKQGPQGQRREM